MSDHSPATGGSSITSSNGRTDTDIRAYVLDPDASAKRVSEESGRLFSQEECRLELCILSAHDPGMERPSVSAKLVAYHHDAN